MPKAAYPLNRYQRLPAGRSAQSITTIGTDKLNGGKDVQRPAPHSPYPSAYPVRSKAPIGS